MGIRTTLPSTMAPNNSYYFSYRSGQSEHEQKADLDQTYFRIDNLKAIIQAILLCQLFRLFLALRHLNMLFPNPGHQAG